MPRWQGRSSRPGEGCAAGRVVQAQIASTIPRRIDDMRRIIGILIGSAVALAMVGAASASAATVVVRPSAMGSTDA
jgi:hypothetical protein